MASVLVIPQREATFAGSLEISGDLTVRDDLTVIDDATITGNAAVASISGNVEVLAASTRALTSADNGKTFVLNLATGIDVALPAVGTADVGLNFTFVVGLAASTETYTVTAQAADLLTGRVLVHDTDTANTIASYAADGSDDLIFIISDTADLPGGWAQFICVSATAWLVRGTLYCTGNTATPFS